MDPGRFQADLRLPESAGPRSVATSPASRPTAVWLLDGTESYGLRTVLLQLARGLAQRGRVRLVALAATPGPLTAELQSAGSEVVCLHHGALEPFRDERGRRHPLRAVRNVWRMLRRFPGTIEALHECQADVVHSHQPQYHALAAILGLLAGVPVIWHWHGPFNVSGLAAQVLRGLGRVPVRVLCISRFVRDTLPPGLCRRAVVVYNAVEVPESRPAVESLRARYHIPADAPLVGAFGHVIPRKGFAYFVEAAGLIARSMPSSRFALVGGPPEDAPEEFQRLRELVRRLELEDRFTFTGPLPGAAAWMSEFDLIVVPTIPYALDAGEGFGLVVVEAMAAGVPPIVTSCGAFPEIVEDGVSGVVVEPRSAPAIAQAALELLADEPRRRAMGRAARRRVADCFSVEHFTRQVEDLYLQVAQERRQP